MGRVKVLVCTGEEGWLYAAQVPGDEQCDYMNNDCDGLTDEDFKDEESGRVTIEHAVHVAQPVRKLSRMLEMRCER